MTKREIARERERTNDKLTFKVGTENEDLEVRKEKKVLHSVSTLFVFGDSQQ